MVLDWESSKHEAVRFTHTKELGACCKCFLSVLGFVFWSISDRCELPSSTNLIRKKVLYLRVFSIYLSPNLSILLFYRNVH